MVVPGRNQKVSASGKIEEEGENNDSVELVNSSIQEVITIDDSDEDIVEIVPQESLSQLVPASIQTAR